VLLVLMAVAVVVLARVRNLFAVIVLSGLYSFLMATVLVALDAVDVAMTEASVGAGISTVLLLGALHLCRSEEAKPVQKPWLPLAVSAVCGLLLVYGSLGLPAFADPAGADPHARRAALPEGRAEGDRRTERRDGRARKLPRLRHAGRDDGGLHRRRRRGRAAAPAAPPQGASPVTRDLILRVVAKLFLPFILLFALYVQFHGDFGPGGGFQAGVIVAAAVVFYALIYGLANARRVVPERLVES
jgi:multicomponent Na+:H+ antiporter subunit B